MAFRRGMRRRKPAVFWLQDRPRQGYQKYSTTLGFIPTTFLPLTVELNQLEQDPAELRGDVATLGAAEAMFSNPRGQLLTDPGWRMMRCVGNFRVALKQQNHALDTNLASPLVHVTAGLCVRERDSDGNYINDTQLQLGDHTLGADDVDRGRVMRGTGAPWIWRRSWVLRNSLATGVLDNMNTATYISDSMNPSQYQSVANYSAFTDDVKFPMGYQSTDRFPARDLGSFFDIKRHVTLKHNEELHWAIHAIDMGYNPLAITLMVQVDSRTLIARAGRPFNSYRR